MKWYPQDDCLGPGETLVATFEKESDAKDFLEEHCENGLYEGKDYEGNNVKLCGVESWLLPGNNNTSRYCITGYPQ